MLAMLPAISRKPSVCSKRQRAIAAMAGFHCGVVFEPFEADLGAA